MAVEISGVFGQETQVFFVEMARQMVTTGEELDLEQCIIQHISSAVQRGNTSAALGSVRLSCTYQGDWCHYYCCCYCSYLLLYIYMLMIWLFFSFNLYLLSFVIYARLCFVCHTNNTCFDECNPSPVLSIWLNNKNFLLFFFAHSVYIIVNL